LLLPEYLISQFTVLEVVWLQSTEVSVQLGPPETPPAPPPDQVEVQELEAALPVPPGFSVTVTGALQLRKVGSVVRGSRPPVAAVVVAPLYAGSVLPGLEGAGPPTNGAGKGYAPHRA
jgi:hypothetical protein